MLKKWADLGYELVGLLFAAILIYLLYLAAFTTTEIDALQRSYLTGDSAFLNLLYLALFVLLLVFASRLCKKMHQSHPGLAERFPADRIRKLLLLMQGVLAAFVVLGTLRQATTDQYIIFDAAAGLVSGKHEMFFAGGYMDMHPNQNGIVFFLSLLTLLFGSYNYPAFMLLNVLALVYLMYNISYMADICATPPVTSLRARRRGMLFCFLAFFFHRFPSTRPLPMVRSLALVFRWPHSAIFTSLSAREALVLS